MSFKQAPESSGFNPWDSDPGLKRAAELMKRISDSADRHRQIIAENNSLNKTPDIKSPEDIYKLMPGLKERMEQSLDNHGKLYFKLTEEYKSNNKEPK